MRTVTARVNTASPVAYVRLDEFHGARVAVQAVIEAGGGGGGPTVISDLGNNSTFVATGSIAITCAKAVQAGVLVVVFIFDNYDPTSTTFLVDSKGNTYTRAVMVSGANATNTQTWYSFITTPLTTSDAITYTTGAGFSGSQTLSISAVSQTGYNAYDPATTNTSGPTFSANYSITGAGAAAVANEINFALVASPAVVGPSAGWNVNPPSSPSTSFFPAWQVNTGTSPLTMAGTITSSFWWNGQIVSFKPSPNPPAFQIDYTFEDPNDLISPVPLASIAWDHSLIPGAAQSALANTSFSIATGPIWARVQLQAGATSVRVNFTQYEAYYA